MTFLCLFFFLLIPHPINIKVPDKISGLTGKTHPCLIFQLQPISFPSFFLLFAFFKHLNNKEPVSTISVKTQSIIQDQSRMIHFIFITVYSSVSFNKSLLKTGFVEKVFHCLWGFSSGENGAGHGLLAFFGGLVFSLPFTSTIFYFPVYLSHKFIVTVQPRFGLKKFLNFSTYKGVILVGCSLG